MDLDFAVLADGVAPRPDGKLDIYGAGFDAILAPAVPAQHARLAVAVRVLLSRQEAEERHDLDLILERGGTEIARAHGELQPIDQERIVALPADTNLGLGLILTFENLVFPEYGAYALAIQWDGDPVRPPIQLSVIQPTG
jgi:hypothetical protein